MAFNLTRLPKVVKDFAVYFNGIRYLGQVSEIELPKIVLKTEDLRTGFSSMPVTLGLEPLEATITMHEQTKEMFLLMGVLNNTTGVPLVFKAYQEGDGGMITSDAINITMRGVFTEIDLGTIKRGELPSYKIKVKLLQYIYMIDGIPLITIDPYTNTFGVGPVDQQIAAKKAIGIL